MRKQDFPIFKHYPKLVYLDSAATSQKPKTVIDAVRLFFELHNAPIHRSMYPLGDTATDCFEMAREKIAKFLGARESKELVFTKSSTEGVNLVAYSWARFHLCSGDEIVITVAEHHANMVPWQEIAKAKHLTLKYANVKKDGSIDFEHFVSLIGKKTKLVAFTHASNVTGELVDVKRIIENVRKKNPNTRIFIDAPQAVGRVQVNFKELDADFLVCSGHKFYGPSGVGILLIKKSVHCEMRPFLTGGGMIFSVKKEGAKFQEVPDLFEGGTPAAEAIVGLGAAVDFIGKVGLKKIREHEIALVQYALGQLKYFPEIHVVGPKDPQQKVGVISFYHEKVHAHDIASLLGEENICVRAGHHCAMPLHKELGIPATARISFSIFNEKKDIDKVVFMLKKINEII